VQRACPVDDEHEFLEGARVVNGAFLDDLGVFDRNSNSAKVQSRSRSLSKACSLRSLG
jgi:hypothetical protein